MLKKYNMWQSLMIKGCHNLLGFVVGLKLVHIGRWETWYMWYLRKWNSPSLTSGLGNLLEYLSVDPEHLGSSNHFSRDVGVDN